MREFRLIISIREQMKWQDRWKVRYYWRWCLVCCVCTSPNTPLCYWLQLTISHFSIFIMIDHSQTSTRDDFSTATINLRAQIHYRSCNRQKEPWAKCTSGYPVGPPDGLYLSGEKLELDFIVTIAAHYHVTHLSKPTYRG